MFLLLNPSTPSPLITPTTTSAADDDDDNATHRVESSSAHVGINYLFYLFIFSPFYTLHVFLVTYRDATSIYVCPVPYRVGR